MRKVTVRVPATTANCGPGFDCLGAACSLYNEFEYEIVDRKGFFLEVAGEGTQYLRPSGRNLAFSSFFSVWNKVTARERIGLKVKMLNRIPMSRGLGSSSTAIVAGVFAASILSGAFLSKEEMLNFAAAIEGHPDNVAPAIYGGFTVSYMAENTAHALRFLPQKTLKFIAAVPETRLPTALARQAIPEHVAHQDAVFNVSRAALLTSALLSGKYEFLAAAMEDKLHQPYRKHLITGIDSVFDAARKHGAYNAVISGAGSTIMAYAAPDADTEKIGRAMCEAFKNHNVQAVYHVLDLDTEGVKEIKKNI